MEEYSTEMLNTASWKKDLKGAREKVMQEWVKEFGNEKGEIMLYTPIGCDTCGGTGYKGRVGLHELLIGTDAVKKNIQEHARVSEMLATALEEGMRTLKQDGIEKVLGGVTDMAASARSLHQVGPPPMNQLQRRPDSANLFERLEQLNQIGMALSKETDINRLLEAILLAAKNITNADGGTLYRVMEERTLKFEIMRNDTLNIAMGGTTGAEIAFPPIQLFDAAGKPVNTMVVAYAVFITIPR